jgi:hypothetical protein
VPDGIGDLLDIHPGIAEHADERVPLLPICRGILIVRLDRSVFSVSRTSTRLPVTGSGSALRHLRTRITPALKSTSSQRSPSSSPGRSPHISATVM